MAIKKRNNERHICSNTRGYVSRVRCYNCYAMVAKDKVIKKTIKPYRKIHTAFHCFETTFMIPTTMSSTQNRKPYELSI